MKTRTYEQLLDEAGADGTCGNGDEYCFFREFFRHLQPSERSIVQLKCIEKFKFVKSKDAKEDITPKAGQLWAEGGYAKAFADVYEEDLSINEVFKKVGYAQI